MPTKMSCRICLKQDNHYSGFVNIFEAYVNDEDDDDDGGENDLILLVEAMQQLTGVQVKCGEHMSNKLCLECENRIKFAYEVRTQIIEAIQPPLKPKRSVEVYEIIATADDHEQLTFITTTNGKYDENESQFAEILTENSEDAYRFGDEAKQYEIENDTNAIDFDGILSIDDSSDDKATEQQAPFPTEIRLQPKQQMSNDKQYIVKDEPIDAAEAPLDAVSFLLDNAELFEGKKTEKSDQFRRHMCQVCDKMFLRKSNLVDHLRLHANLRPYKCNYCEKAFVQAGNYRAHLRIHTKERPFQCSMCSKSYNQSSALKVHIRSHTNEKNYICDVCDKAFTNSSDLKKHKRVHDPSQKIKCEFCDKTFAQRINLKNHVYRHHEHNYKEIQSKNNNNKRYN